MKRRILIAGLLVLSGVAAWIFRQLLRPGPLPEKPRTVEQVLAAISEPVRKKLAPKFAAAGVAYPPANLVPLGVRNGE